MKEELFTDLKAWHPGLSEEYCPTIKYVYPSRFDSIVAPFRLGETTWGWTYKMKPSKFTLGWEHKRLLYALGSSLISLSLDGIVKFTFADPVENCPQDQLGYQMNKLLQEELLQFLEVEKEPDMDTSTMAESTAQRVSFPPTKGGELASSLAFGRIQQLGKFQIHDQPSPALHPVLRFVDDFVEWEEMLPFMVVVETQEVDESTPSMPEAKKSILKPYRRSLIKYDVVDYDPDPDSRDRGKFRFP